MAKHDLTFVALGIILVIIGLILSLSIKFWASIPIIIGIFIVVRGLSPKPKRVKKEESPEKEKTEEEITEQEESEEVEEEPEGEEIEEEPEEEAETEDSEEEDEEEYKSCSECGKKINYDADKCLYCGAEQ